MRTKFASLAFLAAFAIGSSIVYLKMSSKVDQTASVKRPIAIKEYPSIEFDDPEVNQFDYQVGSLIRSKDFRGLDALAQDLVNKKPRFKGGVWQIFKFDLLVSSPPTTEQSESTWNDHIRFVRSWVKASPESIYAKVALSNTEIGFGDFLRGDGYANEVPPGAWAKFREHIGAANSAIDEAENLPKYVGYHSTKLSLARLDEEADFDKLYETAITFEPKYEYFYKHKAQYLLPRWNGKPGDSEIYAEHVRTALGPVEGVKMYSVIIAELGRVNDLYYLQRHRVSWHDVVKGFELREAEFGTSRLRLNEFARLAVSKNDIEKTCEAFKRLASGDAYEPDVWESQRTFTIMQASTLNTMCKTVQLNVEN